MASLTAGMHQTSSYLPHEEQTALNPKDFHHKFSRGGAAGLELNGRTRILSLEGYKTGHYGSNLRGPTNVPT